MTDTRRHNLLSLDRLNAFSDGVIAIVITILVLEVALPATHDLKGGGLGAYFKEVRHELLIYFVTFWLVGMYWMAHRHLTDHLKGCDRTFFVMNLGFLLSISILPFLTDLMGTFKEDWLVVLVYGLVHLWAYLSLVAMWSYALAHPAMTSAPVGPTYRRHILMRTVVIVLIIVAAVLVSTVNAKAGIALFLVMPVFYFWHYLLEGRMAEDV